MISIHVTELTCPGKSSAIWNARDAIEKRFVDESVVIYPLRRYLIPADATHIVRYNK